MSILKIQFIDDEGRRCTSFLNTHHPCLEIISTTIHSEEELDKQAAKICPFISLTKKSAKESGFFSTAGEIEFEMVKPGVTYEIIDGEVGKVAIID